MTSVKAILFLLLVPGSVTVFVPWVLFDLSSHGISRGTPMTRLAAIVVIVGGAALLLRAMWVFVVEGRGTPSPTDSPTELVVRGPYRITRNPMYVGVLLVLAAESLLYSLPALFVYTVAAGVMFHLFVVLYEEPTLRRRFGSAYEAYCSTVPRWLPAARATTRAGDLQERTESGEPPDENVSASDRKE